MKKLKTTLAILLCFTLVGCQSKPKTDDSVSTTPLAQGDLMNEIVTTGTIKPSNQIDVASSAGVPIKEIKKNVGDSVLKGDVLCVLDTTTLTDQLTLAQKTLSNAQTDYDNTISRAETEYGYAVQNREVAIQRAQDAINAARKSYADGVVQSYSGLVQESTKASNDMADYCRLAQNNGATITSGKSCGDNTITEAEVKCDTVKNADGSEVPNPNKTACELNRSSMQSSKNTYEKALQEWNDHNGQWQFYYDNADEYNCPELKSAINSYNDVVNGQNGSLVNMENDLADKRRNTASLDAARAAVKELQDKITSATVVAPMDGTIIASTAKINGIPGSGEALYSIANSTDYIITGLLNQYDSTQVTIGMDCVVESQAIEDSLTGTLTGISPTATDANGNFTITVKINDPQSVIKSGMSGKIRVITSSAKNVFYVPTSSIGMDANGNSVIYSYDGKNSTPITVTTGLSTDYYTEVSGTGLSTDLEILDVPMMEDAGQ